MSIKPVLVWILLFFGSTDATKFVLLLLADGDGDVLAGDGEVVVEAVGGGLGGHVGGTEYLPPKRLYLLISSQNAISD